MARDGYAVPKRKRGGRVNRIVTVRLQDLRSRLGRRPPRADATQCVVEYDTASHGAVWNRDWRPSTALRSQMDQRVADKVRIGRERATFNSAAKTRRPRVASVCRESNDAKNDFAWFVFIRGALRAQARLPRTDQEIETSTLFDNTGGNNAAQSSRDLAAMESRDNGVVRN